MIKLAYTTMYISFVLIKCDSTSKVFSPGDHRQHLDKIITQVFHVKI